MKILVTGAKGFIGRNLVENLKNLQTGKDKTRTISIEEIIEYDIQDDISVLEEACKKVDVIFHLAGVNRPKDEKEFMEGNYQSGVELLEFLRERETPCKVMLASSAQASLIGRYADSAYGKSKKAGEDYFFQFGKETNHSIYVYRFPNVFGKWCRPNYNSAVATFCHNIANDLEITVSDPSIELELVYIDDIVQELFDLLEGKEHHCEYDGLDVIEKKDGKYCFVPVTHKVTLGEIVKILQSFQAQPQTLIMPELLPNSFEKKLYSTYLSYLPKEKVCVPLHTNQDERGSFTELLKSFGNGQFSVNITKPGYTKGQHWHNTKWEFFIVVSGHALIKERRIDSEEILSFEVSGDKMEAVHMLPGYTHSITNLSDTEDLITMMWTNEIFEQDHPDTFHEDVR